MSVSADLRSISCTGCGAGLPVLGGGRVTTHICGYCGSELDALDNYRILRTFTELDRPATPLRIGAEGAVAGVAYRVIGVIGLSESHGGRSWVWVDHLIYSDTHGYAWLTLEDSHLIFTRRWRKPLRPEWISPAEVERAETPPRAMAEGKGFTYYETTTSVITFAEGEFTWRPAVGDRSQTVSVLSEDAMLHYTQSGSERAIERSVYLPQAETLAAFGIPRALPPAGIHPLQPYAAGPNDAFLRNAAIGFGGVCLALSLWMVTMGRPILPPQTFAADQLPTELVLEIDSPGRLAEIAVSGTVNNGWAFVELTLTDPDDQPVFIAGREIAHYSGYDDGPWTEDDSRTRLLFRPAEAGTYTLEIDVPEAGLGEAAGGGPVPAVTVSASNGAGHPLWTLLAALAFGAVALWKAAGPFQHRRARWKGTDWTDED
ncbi:DUF4178 domain-containing protein [Fertoebacter nigrum]|uniref:DUF4178 domain-containing protein n=1 Tax=Fertoeibacter niger TaxID=2656921 RepID=A0A8X8H1J2_9RHOB|nr:DUF4178 domain-containing protein [Fertoeibacter niger]NUB45295.1 DUF4178 domain-containing protein [Fertoeibacter niger]